MLIIRPPLQMKKVKHREVMQLNQSHRANERQVQAQIVCLQDQALDLCAMLLLPYGYSIGWREGYISIKALMLALLIPSIESFMVGHTFMLFKFAFLL